jgi:VWFA-related protein
VRNRRSAWLAVAALSAPSLGLGTPEAPPDLTGRWQLNEKESEDARAKFAWAGGGAPRRPSERPAYPGERRPGERGPGGRNQGDWDVPPTTPRTSVAGSLPPEFGDFLEPAKALVITGTSSELTFDEGRGRLVRLPIDGTPQKQEQLTRVAHWDGETLVVENRVESSGKLTIRYSLMPGTRRLEVYSRLAASQGGAITVRRVYDAAEASGSSAATPGAAPPPPVSSTGPPARGSLARDPAAPDEPRQAERDPAPRAEPATAAAARERGDVPSFGVTTELVYVRFHVERKGEYVDRLSADQIRVLEDGRPQTVALLETPSTRERTLAPEITLALDVSSSVMDAGLLDERLIRDVFLAGLSRDTSVGLCAFGGELRCFAPPTHDAQRLLHAFQEALFFGQASRGQGTRLYASLAELCHEEAVNPPSPRALVVFSDGLDNHGGNVKEAINGALASDVRVYAVKLSQAFQETAPLRAGGFGRPPARAMYDYRKLDLNRLAGETGGRAYEPATVDKRVIAEILRDIATEISMEHVVGYQPQGAATGRKRRVKVELADKSIGRIPDGERTLLR